MPDQYQSFLLRMWRIGTPKESSWRFILEDPHTRETIGFDTMEAFSAYLLSLTQAESRNGNNLNCRSTG